jgi:hypothetical protein
MVDPRLAKSSTDSDDPKRITPYTLTAEPNRAKERMLHPEPMMM